MMHDTPLMSVVVLAYRNDDTLAAAVGSLLDQERAEVTEIIVVVSGVEESGKIQHELPQVRVLESLERLLPGAARNVGVEAARGSIVAFLAADCIAEPGWVQHRLLAHDAGHLCVGSAVTIAGPRTPSSWGHYYSLFPNRLPSRPAGIVSLPDAAVHSTSFRRELLLEAGSFPNDVAAGEDTEMIQRLGERGVEIWFEPAVRTAHLEPTSLMTALKDHWRRGRLRATVDAPPAPDYQGSPDNLRRGIRRSRYVLRRAWEHGRGQRWRIVLTAPWTIACAMTNQMGWGYQTKRAWLEHHSAVRPLPARVEE